MGVLEAANDCDLDNPVVQALLGVVLALGKREGGPHWVVGR